jgi:hypothetical protein
MRGQRRTKEALVGTSLDKNAKIISPVVSHLAIFLTQFC